MGNPLEGRRPTIEYPCTWTYRVIGRDELLVRAALVELVGVAEHTLTLSAQSSSGKYRTLQLDVTVRDEAHRLELFARIAQHPDVRFVV
ncbi:MAG: DUF493 domain-containing protein [Planctomycetes bacterium]|nr:DUF493 domain-containing protein [Planctomycetota bacterium]